jgi:hypothetical protein
MLWLRMDVPNAIRVDILSPLSSVRNGFLTPHKIAGDVCPTTTRIIEVGQELKAPDTLSIFILIRQEPCGLLTLYLGKCAGFD